MSRFIILKFVCFLIVSQEYSFSLFTELSVSSVNKKTFLNPGQSLFKPETQSETIRLNGLIRYEYFNIDFNLEHRSIEFKNGNNDFKLREFFIEYPLDESLDVFIGRKLFRQGVGYYKNPAAYLNTVKDAGDESDRLKKRLGRDAIGLNYYFENSDFEIVYTPNYTGSVFTGHQITGKYYFLYENTDISLVYNFHSKLKNQLGLSVARTMNDYLEIHSELSFQTGSDKLYHQLIDPKEPFRLLKGSPYLLRNDDRINYHLLAGVNISSSFGLNLISEYVYNSEGLRKSEWSRLVQYSKWLDLIEAKELKTAIDGNRKWIANSLNNQREYLFNRLAYGYKKINMAFIGLHNLYDSSAIFISEVTYSEKTLFFRVQSTWFTGKNTTDYGSLFKSNELLFSFSYLF